MGTAIDLDARYRRTLFVAFAILLRNERIFVSFLLQTAICGFCIGDYGRTLMLCSIY